MLKCIPLLILFAGTQLSAQDIEQYRWKNRLVLLLTDHPEDQALQKQLKVFESNLEGLKERKLEIIHLCPDQIRIWDPAADILSKSDGQIYQKYRSKSTSFEMVLIGLDGGEKLRTASPISLDRLFAVIDAMPMRRWELDDK